MPSASETRLQAVLDEHLLNAAAVWNSVTSQRELPPLQLRRGLTIYHDHRDNVLEQFEEVCIRRAYSEPAFYLPRPADCIIDIGAGIGVFAIHLSALAADIRVLCTEPTPDAAARLRRNLVANSLQHSVRAVEAVVYARDDRRSSPEHGDCARVKGPAQLSLHQLFEMCESEHIDLVRMNTDDAEPELIRSSSAQAWRPVLRVAVKHRDSINAFMLAEITQHLQRCGFDRFDLVHTNNSIVIRGKKSIKGDYQQSTTAVPTLGGQLTL